MADTDLRTLVERAKTSELFTAPRLEADFARFLEDHAADVRELAAAAVDAGVQHVYWLGSGGSWSALYSGKYLLDRFTTLTSDVLSGTELITRQPPRLDANAWVFAASYSGGTEDTLAGLRFAKTHGARTVGIVRRRDAPGAIAREADAVIDYGSDALYVIPLAVATLFALEVARLQGRAADVDPILAGLHELPPVLGRVFRESEAEAASLSERFADSGLLTVLGMGPLYGLAYKFALTVFMENIRIHGSIVASDEFRHGPVEMLDRQPADCVFLVGADATRAMTLRVLELVQQRENVRTIVYDATQYADVHPLLGPFVLLVPLQWFAVYSALRAGITDLDDRAFMGRGVLSQGGANWP
jgi:fructoselysine-6-P-deglycase FrlB-like protein